MSYTWTSSYNTTSFYYNGEIFYREKEWEFKLFQQKRIRLIEENYYV